MLSYPHGKSFQNTLASLKLNTTAIKKPLRQHGLKLLVHDLFKRVYLTQAVFQVSTTIIHHLGNPLHT